MFSNDEFIKLLGYRDLGLDEKDDVIIDDIHSIIMPRKEFDCIVRESLDYILTERDKFMENSQI